MVGPSKSVAEKWNLFVIHSLSARINFEFMSSSYDLWVELPSGRDNYSATGDLAEYGAMFRWEEICHTETQWGCN